MTNATKTTYRVGIRTCSDYSPFGVELDGRTVSGGYRYGFQNQEKDDEIKGEGNSINYTFRMHDSRLGRFFNVDPLSPNYPGNSQYAFSLNRVIDAIELEGLEAWEVKNKWSAEYIAGYRAAVVKISDQWIKENKSFTCEDFALAILIKYSKDNNLPLTIQNGSGSYNQEYYENGDYFTFYEDVLKTTAANDIAEFNAIFLGNQKKDIENGKTGSLILHDSDSDGIFNHTQVITLSDKKTKSLFTRQGNLHYRLLANSPGNWFYAGVPIEKTVWNFKGNYHYNFISGNKISNPMQSLNPSLFDWDFQKFNNYSVDSRGKGKIKGPADSVKSKSKSSTPPNDDIKKPKK